MPSFTFLYPDAPRPTALNNPFPIYVDWLAAPIELEELDAEEWDRLYEFILDCQTFKPPEPNAEDKLKPDVKKRRKHKTLKLMREAQSEVEWRLREIWYQAGGHRSAPPLLESVRKTLFLPPWTGKPRARKNLGQFNLVRPAAAAAPAVPSSSADTHSQAGSEDEGEAGPMDEGDNRDRDGEMTVIEVIERNKNKDKSRQRMNIRAQGEGRAQLPTVTPEPSPVGHDHSDPDVDREDRTVPTATREATEASEATPSLTNTGSLDKGKARETSPDVDMNDAIVPTAASTPSPDRPDDSGDSDNGEITSTATVGNDQNGKGPAQSPLPAPFAAQLSGNADSADSDTDTQSYNTAFEQPELRDEGEEEVGRVEILAEG